MELTFPGCSDGADMTKPLYSILGSYKELYYDLWKRKWKLLYSILLRISFENTKLFIHVP